MRARAALAALLAAVAVLAVTAACGVPNQDEAHRIEIGTFLEDVDQLSQAAQVPDQPADGASITVYLVDRSGQHLVGVPRTAPYSSLEQILKQLFLGPAASEAATGLRTAISTRTRVRAADISNGLATIDVQRPLTDSAGYDNVLALAQIVLTASQVRGVEGVRLALDGVPMPEAPTGDGASTTRPLTAQDYARFLAP